MPRQPRQRTADKAPPASPRRQWQQPVGQPGSDAAGGGSLKEQLRSTRSPERVVQLLQQARQICDVADVTTAVNRLVQLASRDCSLGSRCQAAFQQLAQLAHSQQLDPWAVAQFIWAAAKLWEGMEVKQPFRVQPEAWQQKMGAALADRRCKPQTLANSLWGASKLGWQLDDSQAAAADAAIQRLAAQMSSQNVSNTLVAYANGSWQLRGSPVAALLQRLEQVLPQAEPQHVANSLWAIAKLGLQLSGSVQAAFEKALRRVIYTAISLDLANILWACANLRWSPDGSILAAAVAAMLRCLATEPNMAAQAINNFLWGLAELQEQGVKLPADLRTLLEAAADWAGSRWGQLSALDVTDLCFNLARLRHQPGTGWIAAAVARCLECIAAKAAGAHFAAFIWACSTWGHQLQRSELEQLVPAAVDSIAADWPVPGRGGALRLADALTRRSFHVGPDRPAATAALEGRLLPLVCTDIDLVAAGRLHPQIGELPYLASWAATLAAIGLCLPEQQLDALCQYVASHRRQLQAQDRSQLQQAFDTWGYQRGQALLAELAAA